MSTYLSLIVAGLLLTLVVGLIFKRKNLDQANITKWKIDKQSRHYRWTVFWLERSFWKEGTDGDGEYRFQPKSLCSYFWLMIGSPLLTLLTGCAFAVMFGAVAVVATTVYLGPVTFAVMWLYDPVFEMCGEDVDVTAMDECMYQVPNALMYAMIAVQALIYWVTWRCIVDKNPLPVIDTAASVSWEFAKSMKYGVCPRLEYFDPVAEAKQHAREAHLRKLERAYKRKYKLEQKRMADEEAAKKVAALARKAKRIAAKKATVAK